MARGNDRTDGNLFRLASDMGLTAYPCTFSAWYYPNDLSALNEVIVSFTQSTTNFNHIFLFKRSTDTLVAEINTEGSGQDEEAVSTNTFTEDAWNHCAGIWASSTDRRAYLNGDIGNGGSNTVDHAFPSTGINRTSLGQRDDTGANRSIDGRIADVAIWNVELSTNEVTALAAGASPLRVRPADLLAYWPLFGVTADDEPDYSGNGRTQVEVGTMTVENHSPTQSPFAYDLWRSPAAVAAAVRRIFMMSHRKKNLKV